MTRTLAETIAVECARQEEACRFTAAGLYIWQNSARFWRNSFVVTPIIIGSLACTIILFPVRLPHAEAISAGLAAFAGFFPAIFVALGMDMRVREIGEAANEFTNLRDRFRILRDTGAQISLDDLCSEFEDVMKRMERARNSSPPLPEKFFLKGRRKILTGHYTYSVDQHPPSAAG